LLSVIPAKAGIQFVYVSNIEFCIKFGNLSTLKMKYHKVLFTIDYFSIVGSF